MKVCGNCSHGVLGFCYKHGCSTKSDAIPCYYWSNKFVPAYVKLSASIVYKPIDEEFRSILVNGLHRLYMETGMTHDEYVNLKGKVLSLYEKK